MTGKIVFSFGTCMCHSPVLRLCVCVGAPGGEKLSGFCTITIFLLWLFLCLRPVLCYGKGARPREWWRSLRESSSADTGCPFPFCMYDRVVASAFFDTSLLYIPRCSICLYLVIIVLFNEFASWITLSKNDIKPYLNLNTICKHPLFVSQKSFQYSGSYNIKNDY